MKIYGCYIDIDDKPQKTYIANTYEAAMEHAPSVYAVLNTTYTDITDIINLFQSHWDRLSQEIQCYVLSLATWQYIID